VKLAFYRLDNCNRAVGYHGEILRFHSITMHTVPAVACGPGWTHTLQYRLKGLFERNLGANPGGGCTMGFWWEQERVRT
jgi:hypothetical protein